MYYKFGIRYKPFALNFTKNLCDIIQLDEENRGVDMNLYLGPLSKYSNLITECPLKV